MKSSAEAEREVRSWGFKSHVFTWTDSPYAFNLADTDQRDRLTPVGHSNAHYPPHKHSGLTTHLILRGELTISYPDDLNPKKETFGPGSRLDVAAGRKHEVWVGRDGCTYCIGE